MVLFMFFKQGAAVLEKSVEWDCASLVRFDA